MANSASQNESGGILTRRKRVLFWLLVFLFFALLSWHHVLKYRPVLHHDVSFFGLHPSPPPITVLGLVFSVLFMASAAVRSPLRTDRFVFGIGTIPLCLAVVTVLFQLTGPQLLAIRSADALCWTIAVGICAATLAGWEQQSVNPKISDVRRG